jgi:predicted PurR-regulated permease PerM
MTVQEQTKWWGIALVGLVLALWLLEDVLLPFVVGSAVAYFMDPVADRLERAGCSRVMATLIIAVIALLVVALALITLIPTLISQGNALVQAAPDLFGQLRQFLQDRLPMVDENSVIRPALQSLGETIKSKGAEFINTIFTSAMGVIDVLVFMLVVPVVAFYMLLDWDRMIAVIDSWLPIQHAPELRRLATEVDNVLAGFVRGQLSVCGIQGVFYASLLALVGLNYGIVVGVIAGLISFIPYIGAAVGGILAIGLALFQFWDQPWWIGAVVAIFVAGQMLEGNYLTPKLVGKSVGLHPVWLLFALSAFGSFFGFVGMLVAVPVAATIGVFARYGVGQYLGGRLYRGSESER